ncbi:hypothetical protein GGI20_003275 [Coemansia sp. BCRC 34301]|nr:hypothetical protein GGI20_003275 [Coemansia sp. BCRC 34301]
MADNSTTVVADCSAQQYCTRPGQALNYANPFVVHWNNQLPPLNPASLVTIAVYSTYDLNKPLFQQTSVSNTNGQATLTPTAEWFSRYTGDSPEVGQNQAVYFAVYLQGNDVPAVASMLQLRLTATDAQYEAIQNILHPPPPPPPPPPSSTSHSSTTLSSSPSPSSSSTTTTTTTLVSSTPTTTSTTPESSSLDPESGSSLDMAERSAGGLSGGQIAGIVVGSLALLLLLILLLLLPMHRRRQRRKRLEEKAADTSQPPDSGHAVNRPVAIAAQFTEKSASDTPLLLSGGRPNNSFTSQDADSQMQALSLESPRILVSMPSSTRSPKDPILSTDDARQIGDIFRDALRKPPPSEDDGNSDDPAGLRHSMIDDEIDDDPGWRERVASERMQRELQQEASILRSVAMRAHGSESASSRPDTPRSDI